MLLRHGLYSLRCSLVSLEPWHWCHWHTDTFVLIFFGIIYIQNTRPSSGGIRSEEDGRIKSQIGPLVGMYQNQNFWILGVLGIRWSGVLADLGFSFGPFSWIMILIIALKWSYWLIMLRIIQPGKKRYQYAESNWFASFKNQNPKPQIPKPKSESLKTQKFWCWCMPTGGPI
jgi:hypothetical protein